MLPGRNRGFVALRRLRKRQLDALALGSDGAAAVSGVVRDPKQLLNERGNAFGGPDLPNKAERGCATCQCFD